MMKFSSQKRHTFSILFLMGYIFVTFFIQQFHHHDHHSDKIESGVKIVKVSHADSDCLVCHFISDTKYFPTEDVNYNFEIPKQVYTIEVTHYVALLFSEIDTLSLRGPPLMA